MLRVLCPLILLAPCALALQVPEDFPGDLSVSEEVGADELRSHVQALASDGTSDASPTTRTLKD